MSTIMPSNRLFLIIILQLVCLPVVHAETVYRSVDDKGVTEFSDKDSHGAKEMKVEKVPTYKFKKIKRATPVIEEKSGQAGPVKIQIVRPTEKETIRNNQGEMTVEVNLAKLSEEKDAKEKKVIEEQVKDKLQDTAEVDKDANKAEWLKEGEKLVLILNDDILLETDKTIIELKNIDRGIHQLKVAIRDAEGKFVTETEPVEFYMKRMSKQFNKPVNPVNTKVTPPTP